jgi:hypothetical protein
MPACAGSFRFAALPPGTYALTLVLAGLAPAAREGIYVAAGFTATIDVPLGLQAIADVVRVEQSVAVFDRQATSIATTFDAAQLATLPGSRTMGAILSATPAVNVSRFDVGGSSLDTGSYGAYEHRCAPGELPCRAPANAPDQLHRQGDLSAGNGPHP